MSAPKIFTRNGKTYVFLREYQTFYLYRESDTGINRKFNKGEVKPKLRMRTRRYNEDEER